MSSAFAFLVAFAIVFKRLGNTYKYYTATRYLSSYPDIVMYQYHYIWYWYLDQYAPLHFLFFPNECLLNAFIAFL